MNALSRDRLVRLAPALLSVVGAVYIVLVAVDSRPIADDWGIISLAGRSSFWSFMNFYLGSTGRFSQVALGWLSGRLFGSAADTVTPLILLALALAFAARTVHGIGRIADAEIGWMASAGLAMLAVVSVLATAPSIYDTVGWLAALIGYLAAPVAAIGVASWLVSEAASGRRTPPVVLAALGLLSAIAAGFHEIVGTSMALAGVLGLVMACDLRRADMIGSRLEVPLAAVTLGAAVGTAANVLGPGSSSRASEQGAHLSLIAAARTALHNLSFLRADVHDAVVLLALATGVVAWQLYGPVKAPRMRRWCGVWALFLLVVPWLVTAALTAWGGSTESGDRSPFRAAFLATGSVALGLALIVFLALSLLPRLLSQTRATVLAVLMVALGTVGIAHKAGPIIRAERLRAHLVSERSVSVRRQLAAGRTTIELAPAPLLTVFTQALDLSFTPLSGQRSGWVEDVELYYGIPSRDRVRIEAAQPRDYCLPGVAATWVGVRSCQELGASPGKG